MLRVWCPKSFTTKICVNASVLARPASTKGAPNPRNDQIKHSWVWVVDYTTGSLSEQPTTLKGLLASIDTKLKVVEQVAESPRPIVRILDRGELYAKRKALRRAQALTKKTSKKEIQCSWNLAQGDLLHKLAKVQRELEDGHRVDLVFAPKHGVALPSPGTRRQLIDKVMEVLGPTATESRAPTSVGLQLTLHLIGSKGDRNSSESAGAPS